MKQKRIIALSLVFIFLINFMPFSKVYAADGDTLKVGVYTQDGVIYESVNVEFVQGDTAYSALSRVVGDIKTKGSGTSIYISSIAGVAEFDQGPLSGWVYAVNGVKPDASAGAYYLNPGDKLVWHYTIDLGEDISKGINKLDSYIAANPPTPPVVEKPVPPVQEKPSPTPEQDKPSSEPSKPNGNGGNVTSKPNENNGNKPGEEISSDINERDESLEVNGEKEENEEVKDEVKSTLLNEDVNKSIEAILSSAKESYGKKVNSQWEAIALTKIGGKVPDEYVTSLMSEIKENKGVYSKITDLEKNIILLNILGYDVTNIEGINLLEILLTSDVEKQGANGIIFAILCLNSIDSEVLEKFWENNETEKELLTEVDLIEILLSYQKDDGGFPLIKGKDVDVDITAMALQALGGIKNKTNKHIEVDSIKVDEAITKVMDYLKKVKFENLESIAQTVIGCSYVGEDPEDFGGVNLIEELLKYKKDNNTFTHIVDADGDDGMSTEQGILALISYKSYKDSKDYLYSGNIKGQNVQIASKTTENNNMVLIIVTGLIIVLGAVVWFLIYKKSKKSHSEE